MYSDPYSILGVAPNASPEEIEAAFREKAKKYHPDVNSSPQANSQMRRLNYAHAILKDVEKRKRYDEEQARRAQYARNQQEYQQSSTRQTRDQKTGSQQQEQGSWSWQQYYQQTKPPNARETTGSDRSQSEDTQSGHKNKSSSGENSYKEDFYDSHHLDEAEELRIYKRNKRRNEYAIFVLMVLASVLYLESIIFQKADINAIMIVGLLAFFSYILYFLT